MSADDYRVLFVDKVSSERSLKAGTIVIAPSTDNWNDFGERILVELDIQPRRDGENQHQRLHMQGLFGFLDEHNGKSDTKHLRALVSEDPATPVPADKVPAFFTMLPDMKSYREIVRQLGPDEARIALRAVNDIVQADDQPSGQLWLRAARESRVFLTAFLRHSESYFAWKNAAPLLLGIEYEQLDRMSEGVRIQFQLAGRPNPHHLQFRFAHSDDAVPQRFAIVIGENGVGKSQTLAQIADAALRNNNKLTDLEGNRPVFNRVLGFYPSASSNSAFPSERRKHPRVWYRRFAMVSGRSRQTTSDLILQLVRGVERIAGRSRYDIFQEAISAIQDHHELVLRTTTDDKAPVSILGLDNGGEQMRLERYASVNTRLEPVRLVEGKTYKLSSGELSFLRFAALAGLYIENGTLLLFDEPETHLHPKFISQFVALLDRLLELTGSAAILATHSVYFVREAIEDQVTVLRSDAERMISAETPTLKTFGADVGAISYFVFGEDQPSRLAQEVENKISDQSVSWETMFETYKDRVSPDLLGEIRARVESSDREANGQ